MKLYIVEVINRNIVGKNRIHTKIHTKLLN